MFRPSTSRQRQRRSISAKLTGLVIASVGAAVAIITGVSAWREGARETALQAERLRSAAAVLASMSGEAAAQRDVSGAYRALRSIRLMPDVVYARVERADGMLLAETGAGVRLARDATLVGRDRASTVSLLSSRSLEVRAPVTYGRRPVGQVVILGRTQGAGSRLIGSLLVSLAAGAAAAGVGFLVALRLRSQIVGPILALTGSMGRVRETHDFTEAVTVKADDEIAELVDGFNAMLAEIRERDGKLAEHMAGLERTVAERTADLREAKDAAEAANHAKSDFLATMSHEIRTPMNGIMVMAEMLAASEAPPKQRRFAEVIARSGSSLLAIINDILDFSKIEAGKMELEAVETDPADIAEDVLSLFWEKARAKNLDLAAYVDPATPALIQGDPVRLRQIVGNLVNNAIKFTEEGGVLVSLGPTQDGRLRIAVQDSGIGIPDDKIPGLFGAFTQADQSTTRRFGGTGLGLAICKRLVEAMGGAFQVKSQVGQGSVFAFAVPMTPMDAPPKAPEVSGLTVAVALSGPCAAAALKRYIAALGASLGEPGDAALVIADAEFLKGAEGLSAPVLCLGEYGDAAPGAMVRDGKAQAAAMAPLRRRDLFRALAQAAAGETLTDPDLAESHEDRAALPSFAGARVLVVDDSAVNREVALEALSRLDIEAEVAVDGYGALEMATPGAFDLVLMDGSMPGMDGYEATREIRKREGDGARTPIVALTAHVVGDAAEQWRDAGMDGVLHKPFTLAAMADELGRHLEAKERAPEPAKAAEPAPSHAPAEAPAAAAMPPQSDLLDAEVWAELQRMAQAGKADFVDRVRNLYLENAPPAARTLIEACEAGDAAGAARAAHALKSMSLNIGAKVVAEHAARIEQDAREGTVDTGRAVAASEVLNATLAVLNGSSAPAKAASLAATGRTDLSDEDRALAGDIERAIADNAFTLVYQPQFQARDGVSVMGCEALIRWTHPERGSVSPGRFIPLAERTGLIKPITLWALGRAMEETSDLSLQVAVNASALDFADDSFPDAVAEILARRGFSPSRLEVEVTETAVLSDAETARHAFDRLHEVGAKVAMDDFGVGFSSLNHLRVFPFDKLKIDQVFISKCDSDVPSAALVHAVVSVGRALGMTVVAEGVETEGQQKFLKVCGVHCLQGYRLAKPMPVGDLRALLAQPVAAAS